MTFPSPRSVGRLLLAQPWLTTARALLVALLVGVGASMLAVADATLVRPFDFPEASRLARVVLLAPGVTDTALGMPLHHLSFQRLREGATAFEMFDGLSTRERALGGESDPESVAAVDATPGVFGLLGAQLAAGRTFDEAQTAANAKVAVLSHALSVRRFRSPADAIGRTVLIDREAHEVIGVLSPEFSPSFLPADLWTPLHLAPADRLNRLTSIQTLARLRPGVSLPQATEQMRARLAAVVAEAPAVARDFDVAVLTLQDALFGPQRPAIILLLLSVAALALLATANLANLTLADVLGRRRELAARIALGASQAQLLLPELLRSATIALVATAAGLVMAAALLPGLQTLAGDSLNRADIRLSGAVVLLMFLFGLVVMGTASVLPVLRVARADVQRSLAGGGRGSTGSRESMRMRSLLVGAQTALAVLMLSITGMVLGGFLRASQVDPGFVPAGLAAAQLRVPERFYPTAPARTALVEAIVAEVRSIPGVTGAAASGSALIPNFSYSTLVEVEGQPAANGQPHTLLFRRVTPGYFETMGITVRSGRPFDARDGASGQPVAIVNAAFARRFWPGEDPVGRRIRRVAPGAVWLVVAGVVEDARENGLGVAQRETLYVPYAQNNTAGVPVTVTARTGTGALLSHVELGAAVRRVDSSQPVARVMALSDFLDASLASPRFRSLLLAGLAALALAICALGTYGVTARTVGERTREIGVRLALGGTPLSVWRGVAVQSLRAVAFGGVAGVLLAAVTTPLMTRVVPDLPAWAASEIAAAVAVLAGVAAVAAFGASARAARLAPLDALRNTEG